MSQILHAARPKRRRIFRAFLSGLFLFLFGGSLFAQPQLPQFVLASKYRAYEQTSATSVEPRGSVFSLGVSFPVPERTNFVVQLRYPSGALLTLTRNSGAFNVVQEFQSDAALEAAFPSGTYSLLVSGVAAANISVGPLAPTFAPTRLTNFDAVQSWSEAKIELRWEAIAGVVRDDLLAVSIPRDDGGFEIGTSTPSGFDPASTTVTLTGYNFVARYSGRLSYLRAVTAAENGGETRVISGRGFELRFPVRFAAPRPVITEQPVDQIGLWDGQAGFRVLARGPEPQTYLWRKEGVAIPGATSLGLGFPALRQSDAGRYTVEVRGPGGVTVSDPADLLLSPTFRASLLAGLPDPGSGGGIDGVGIAARFNSPAGLAVDSTGNVFVADANNHAIRRISPDGVVTTFAGTMRSQGSADGLGAAARFWVPTSVAVDVANNLYVADNANSTIRKISAAGLVTTLAGVAEATGFRDGAGAAARFNGPAGLAIGRDGVIYVCDSANHVIRSISTTGVVATLSGAAGVRGFIDGAASTARFNQPSGIAVGPDGTIYVSDQFGTALRTIYRSGEVRTVFLPPNQLNGSSVVLSGLAVDENGFVYAAARFVGMLRISPQGAFSLLQDGRFYTRIPMAGAGFFRPSGVARDASGTLFVCDPTSNAVVKGVIEAGSQDPKITITSPPQSHALAAGDTILVEAAAAGPDLHYQWRRDGTLVRGATDRSLLVRNGDGTAAGRYTLTASNAIGAAISAEAEIFFGPTNNVGRLSNLSVRSRAAAGAQTLIVGMAVGGSATAGGKPLLIRGVGPALTGFGVAGALADPTLSVYRGTQVLATNDDWGGTPALRDAFSAVGAFGLPAASRDAALGQSFSTGAYTVQIAGSGGATGVALAEIYDAVPGAMAPGAARLINLSARTQVGAGAETLIAGFVIGGATSKTVLIRAIGPALSAFGVVGVLSDPRLQLYRGSEPVAANESWREGGAAISTAFTAVGAFPINDADAALLITLTPGNYSVQVSGRDGGTGIALVEVYELP